MKQELTVKVNAELSVSDETAETCLSLLRIYCRNKLGDFTPCEKACMGCALYNPKSYYCEFKGCPVDYQNNIGMSSLTEDNNNE